MIYLYKNGRTKTISRKSYATLKGHLDGWSVKRPAEMHIEPAPTVVKKKEVVDVEPEKELTRDDMIEFLKSKGQKVHWNLSDDKLKKRYDIENQIG